MSRFLGVDLGTSGVKLLVLDERGTPMAAIRADYPTYRPGPHSAEQQPADWLAALRVAMVELDLAGGLDAVGVGHTPSLVLADDRRRSTGPALTWQDSRAAIEAADLAAALGPPETVVGGILPWSPSFLPAKLWWTARHDPAALAAARWVLQHKDFLGLALTGRAATTVWSSKGLCRIDSGAAVDAVLEVAPGGVALLPARIEPWTALGTVDTEGSRLTGIPVAVGWTDTLAGMLALGTFGALVSFVPTGTSDIVGVSGTNPAPGGGVWHIPATCTPPPVAYAPTQTCGAGLDWLARVVGGTVSELLTLALRGRFDGLGLPTGPAELARGVALGHRQILETAGATTSPVHIGGATGSYPALLQARRETLGRPLVVHDWPTSPLPAPRCWPPRPSAATRDLMPSGRLPSEWPVRFAKSSPRPRTSLRVIGCTAAGRVST